MDKNSFIHNIGLTAASRWTNRDNIAVLMYHGVTPDDCKETDGDWLQVRESAFFEQMDYLHKHYEVVLLKNTTRLTNKPRAIITFDDGYMNNFTSAFPILEYFGLPATIFLVTSTIGTDHMYWYDKLQSSFDECWDRTHLNDLIEFSKSKHSHTIDTYINAFTDNIMDSTVSEEHKKAYKILGMSEIDKMANSGLITFGSHTHQHELLTLLSDEEVRTSLEKSAKVLENIPKNIPAFCYPNGYYKDKHPRMISNAGFDLAVTTEPGFWTPTTSKLNIPRFGIGSNMDINTFANRISGIMDSLVKIKRRLLP